MSEAAAIRHDVAKDLDLRYSDQMHEYTYSDIFEHVSRYLVVASIVIAPSCSLYLSLECAENEGVVRELLIQGCLLFVGRQAVKASLTAAANDPTVRLAPYWP